MSCNWPVKKLGDLVKFSSGGTPSKSNELYWGGDIPWISALSMGSTRYSDSVLKVSKDGSLNGTRIVPKDTVLLLVRGGALHNKIPVGISTREVTFNQDVKALIPITDEITPFYLLFWLMSIRSLLLAKVENTGIGAGKLDTKILQELEIPVPPQNELNRLEAFCKAIDDKIILNTETNQTLEEMAQAIFKSWFVDFDPVKAKMRGEKPGSIDAYTASLFPEKLVESELGMIPEGWDVGTLDTNTSMIIDHRGKTPKKLGSDWAKEGYPAISAKNIKSKKIVRPDTIRFVDEVTYNKWMKEPLIKGDIIMTSEAPMGELYFFDGSRDFCLSQRLYGLRSNNDACSPAFLFNWLQTTKAKTDMEGRASGTTVLGIKQAELRKVKILTPSKEILDKYSVVANDLVDMTAKNHAQNTILEELRDTLLPKLLSGEIELDKADALAEVN